MRSLVSARSKWSQTCRPATPPGGDFLKLAWKTKRENIGIKEEAARQEPVGPGDSQQTAGLRAFSLTCHWEPKVDEATEQEKDWADRSGNTTGAPRHV